ncbi:MAG: hypothetical protein DHS20C21_15310 [Gemmatimonadota bacterium]|nr:MAG: hypothetical protein DHS20C21_15310 [Gemmatimonadota bacterium]
MTTHAGVSRRGRFAWPTLGIAATALALAVAYFPIQTAFLVPTGTGIGALAWRFGLRRGSWYLFLATIPLRQPLGYDVFGTTTIFFSDVLLYVQFAIVFWERGLGSIWSKSGTFRIAVVILAVSTLGLYSAQSLVQGVAQIQRIVGQLMVFYLARHYVRDGEEAARTIVAFLIGMLPAVAFGFYQATIPVGAANFAQWADAPLAHDSQGRSFIRIFSTFDHSLRFSHALTTAFGLSLGLLAFRASPLSRPALVGLTIVFAVCNQFTYSLSGALAMAMAGSLALILALGARAVILLPLLIVALILVTPNAIIYKATQMISGESTSSLARIITYQRTFMVLADHPLTGLGWGSIGETVMHSYRVARLQSIGVGAENWWLHRGLAMGLPGLLLFGAIGVQFLRRVVRKPSRLGRAWPQGALLIGGTAYFAQAMLYPAAGFVAGYVLWILLALAEGADGPLEEGT